MNRIYLSDLDMKSTSSSEAGTFFFQINNTACLKNIFSEDSKSGAGSFIYADSLNNIFVDNLTINLAANVEGGALAAFNMNVIYLSGVKGSKSQSQSGSLLYLKEGNTFSLCQSRIESFQALNNGGAIYMENRNLGIFSNMEFNDGKSTVYGGVSNYFFENTRRLKGKCFQKAIFVNDENILGFFSVRFVNCQSKAGAAVSFNDQNKVYAETAVLEDCYASVNAAYLLNYGNTIFLKNVSVMRCWSIFVALISTYDLNFIELSSIILTESYAEYGGVIHFDSNCFAKLSDLIIECESCYLNSVYSSQLYFREKCTVFIQNIQMKYLFELGTGAAISIVDGVSLVIKRMQLSLAQADAGSFLAIIGDNNLVTVDYLIAHDIFSVENGALIFSYYGKNQLIILNSELYNIRSDLQGGLLFSFEAAPYIYLRNVTANNFSAKIKAGGFCLSSDTIIKIEDSHFVNFSAAIGGLITVFDNSIIILKNSIFTEGLASTKSGILDSVSGNVLLALDCTFTQNTAQQGAVFFSDSNLKFIAKNCLFESNKASDYGGNLMFRKDSISTIKNCTISKNSAKQAAFLFAELNSVSLISNCSFQKNFANFLGVNIILFERGALIVDKCIFIDDSIDLENGGVIVLSKSSNISLSDCYIKNYDDYFLVSATEENIFYIKDCLFVHEKFHNREAIFYDSSKRANFFLISNQFIIKNGSIAKYFFQVGGTESRIQAEKNYISNSFVFDVLFYVNHENFTFIFSNNSYHESAFSKLFSSFSYRKSKPQRSFLNISRVFFKINKNNKDLIMTSELTTVYIGFSRLVIDSSFESSLLSLYFMGPDESIYESLESYLKYRAGKCNSGENSAFSSLIFTENYVIASNDFKTQNAFKKFQNSSFINLNERFQNILISNNFIFIQEVLFTSFLFVLNPINLTISNTSIMGTTLIGQNPKYLIRIDYSMSDCRLTVDIFNSSLICNKATKGGVISLYERKYKQNVFNITFRNCTVQGNYVFEKGGLISIERYNGSISVESFNNLKKEILFVKLINVTMKRNRALLPGAIYIETREAFSPVVIYEDTPGSDQQLSSLDTTYNCLYVFLSEDEKLPPDFKYPAQELNISQSIQYGIELPNTNFCYFSISGFDAFFNKLNLKLHLREEKRFYFLNGDYQIDFILRDDILCAVSISQINKKPIFEVTNTIELPLKSLFPSLTLLTNSTESFLVHFKFDKCKPGHIFNYIEGVCTPCPVTQFSLSPNLQSLTNCLVCSEADKFYCYGADLRSPKKNYWRYSDESNRFLRCPNPDSCEGDTLYIKNLTEKDCVNCSLFGQSKEFALYLFWRNLTSVGSCSQGYRGMLCVECLEPLYSMEENYSCSLCQIEYKYAVKVLGVLIGILLSFSAIWKTLNINFYLEENTGEVTQEFEENSKNTLIIKILLQHLYIITILKVYPWELPQNIKNTLSLLFGATSQEYSETFSFGCIFNALGLSRWPKIHLKLVTIIIFFFAQLFLMILIFKFIRSKNKNLIKTESSSFSRNIGLIKAIVYVYFITFAINFMQPAIDLLLCFDIGDDSVMQKTTVLIKDPGTGCFSEDNIYFRNRFSIPFLSILGFVPIYAIISIFYAARRGNMKGLFGTLGAFFYVYDSRYYLFEFYVLLRKGLFIILKSIVLYFVIIDLIDTSLLIVFLILLFNYLVHSIFKPYSSQFKIINKIERRSFITNISNCLVALIWFSNKNDDGIKAILLILFLFITNVVYFCFLSFHYFSTIREKLKAALNQIKLEVKRRSSKKSLAKPDTNNKDTSPARKSVKYSDNQFIKESNPMKKEIHIMKNCMLMMQEHIITLENLIKSQKNETVDELIKDGASEEDKEGQVAIPEERVCAGNNMLAIPKQEVGNRRKSAQAQEGRDSHLQLLDKMTKRSLPLRICLEHKHLYGISSHIYYLDIVLSLQSANRLEDFSDLEVRTQEKGWVSRLLSIEDSFDDETTKIQVGLQMVESLVHTDSLHLIIELKKQKLSQVYELPFLLNRQFFFVPTGSNQRESLLKVDFPKSNIVSKQLNSVQWRNLCKKISSNRIYHLGEEKIRGVFDLYFPLRRLEEGPKQINVIFEYLKEKDKVNFAAQEYHDVDLMVLVAERFLKATELEFLIA